MTTTPTPWNVQAQVNTADVVLDGGGNVIASTQNNATVVGLSTGGYVVAWEDDTDRFGLGAPDIIGQRYDAFGVRESGEFVVSQTYNDFAQVAVDLAAFSDGSFIGAHQTTGDPLFADGENVTVERFDSGGIRTSFNDFRGSADDTDPAVATFTDDSYGLVYVNDASGNHDLTYVFVNAAGVASTGVNIEIAADALAPEIAALSNGNAVVVYETAAGVVARVVTKAGATVASGLVAGADAPVGPAVAALESGFVAVWQDSAADPGVRFRLFANDGSALGPAQNGSPFGAAGVQDQATVCALDDGGFMIAWRDDTLGSIEGQRFAADGAPVGVQTTLLASELGSILSSPELALLDDGRFAVTATRRDVLNDQDVVSRIWDPRDAVIEGTARGEIITSRVDGASVSGLGGADGLYGGAASDTLIGGGADDSLYGGSAADTLIGGAGEDLMEGQGGDDVFYVQNAGDVVQDTGGVDRVFASADWTLGAAEIEFLRVRGPDGITLTGNSFANRMAGGAGGDRLIGGGGADRLSASGAADTLEGGAGDDRYYVRNAADRVLEVAGEDSIYAFTDWRMTAGQEVEYLVAAGTGDRALTGNKLDNSIFGGAGDDTLIGGLGRDTLTGGDGADEFTYVRPLSPAVYKIRDFEVGEDKIAMTLADFDELTGAVGSTLNAAQFKVIRDGSGGTVDASDRIIYDAGTGMLFYDENGSASGGKAHMATLYGAPALSAADILLV